MKKYFLSLAFLSMCGAINAMDMDVETQYQLEKMIVQNEAKEKNIPQLEAAVALKAREWIQRNIFDCDDEERDPDFDPVIFQELDKPKSSPFIKITEKTSHKQWRVVYAINTLRGQQPNSTMAFE